MPTIALSNIVELLQESLLWRAAFRRVNNIKVHAGTSLRFWLNPVWIQQWHLARILVCLFHYPL